MLGSLVGAAPLPAGPATCGPGVTAPAPATPLPASVSGRVDFYAARYDPRTLQPKAALALGQANAVHPLASSFKPLVVQAILQDVDAGRFTLSHTFTATAATRSIEGYPPGPTALSELVKRAIVRSDNTASDLLQLAYGPVRLARRVQQLSPCTTVLLTTKAWWAAQAGLSAGVLGPDTGAGALAYAGLPFDQRLQQAGRLIAASQQVSGPQVEAALDRYFHGPQYLPALELALQNTSTPQAYTDLMVRTLSGAGLQAETRQLFRRVLAAGCCQPKLPRLRASYWASKAGSGWRLLTLTGLVELPGGDLLAYSYFNDNSATTDAELMELQLPVVVRWIESGLLSLASP